jgi:protein-disulfide isomerase
MKSVLFGVSLAFCCLAAAPDADKGKILGSPAAPVRIEVYSDFECPACRTFHEQLLPMIVRDYVMPGKVAVISHEYPLNIPDHKYSREAADYATAAARLDIYQPVSDALFHRQSEWINSGKVWETVASVLTPDQQKRVQALVKDPSVLTEVAHDVDAGNREPVKSTPTIILAYGTQRFQIPWPVNYNFLRSLINGYLK